ARRSAAARSIMTFMEFGGTPGAWTGSAGGLEACLFATQKPEPGHARAPTDGTESEEIRGVDVVIDGARIVPVRDVVKTRPQGPLKTQDCEPPLNGHVEREEGGIAFRARRRNHLLILVDQEERKTIVPVK